MSAVWQNLIKSLEGGEWSVELSLEENLELHEKHAKIRKEIDRLEKLARKETQPKKKFELAQKIQELRASLESEE